MNPFQTQLDHYESLGVPVQTQKLFYWYIKPPIGRYLESIPRSDHIEFSVIRDQKTQYGVYLGNHGSIPIFLKLDDK